MLLQLLFQNPLAFILVAVGLVAAITIHEFAHAWAADLLGDPTPRSNGRVTLDPRAHLDPLGTLTMLLVGFGWGKPVGFDPYNLKDELRDTALIAVAGPVSNILLALIFSTLLQLELIPFFDAVWQVMIQVNVSLAIFNLVPVHPLDGSKILVALLPKESAYEYEQFMERYGLFVLLLLMLPWNGTSPVSRLISPILGWFMAILT